MDNGGQPAAGGHWLAAAPPNFRDRVVQKIMNNLPQMLHGRQVDDLRLYRAASVYEAEVFNQSNNAHDYLRTISRKMLCFQRKRQPVVQDAPDHQQQAHMGHQMRPLNAVLANSSSAAAMPRTASTIPLTVRPPQVQNMHIKVNQAQPSFGTPVAPPQWHHAPRNTTSTTQVAPVVQLHPRHPAPAVITQVQTQHPARQPQPKLTRMNQQQDLRQSYHTHGGQQSNNVATMQIGHHEGQNRKQFGHPQQQSAREVDWREDIFQKITPLKDAHLSEMMEFERALQARVPHEIKTDEHLKSLPKEQADQYMKAVNIMSRIRYVLSFLQVQKSSIPEHAKDQFDKYQTTLYSLLQFYRESKACNARKDVELQSHNCHELPRVVNITGATDNNQQKHEEQPAVEAFPQSSQNVPAGSPLAQQQNQSEHLAGEAENVEVHCEADAPVAVNLTAVSGDTAHSTGGTCNREVQQEHQTDESIPQLTQNVDPSGTPPAQQQNCSVHSVRVAAEDDDSVRAEAETPLVMETLIKRGINAARSLSPAALRSLASDMGVNLKRAFRHTTSGTMGGSSCAWFDPAGGKDVEAAKTSLPPAALRSDTGVNLKRSFCHTTWDTMDGSSCVWFDDGSSRKSCSKRRRTHHGSLLDEIRATCSMLVETHISISEDDTEGADGTVIELCYNAVSLAPDFRAVIGASEILTKLLVPADYPQSSPVIHGDGKRRSGLPGVVDMAFRRAIGLLPEPRSVEEMARAWDSVARRAVAQFEYRLGGGMFGTRYNHWESCIPV